MEKKIKRKQIDDYVDCMHNCATINELMEKYQGLKRKIIKIIGKERMQFIEDIFMFLEETKKDPYDIKTRLYAAFTKMGVEVVE